MVLIWIYKITNFLIELKDFEKEGQTLVEYALIIAFVAIVLVGALTFLGVNLSDIYESFANAIPN